MSHTYRGYQPTLPPNVDPESVTELRAFTTWVLQEFREIANMLQSPLIPRLHAEPEKPTDGFLVIADGTHWNPGSGRGLYIYRDDTAAWVFIATA